MIYYVIIYIGCCHVTTGISVIGITYRILVGIRFEGGDLEENEGTWNEAT
jgi:hypothetical protein